MFSSFDSFRPVVVEFVAIFVSIISYLEVEFCSQRPMLGIGYGLKHIPLQYHLSHCIIISLSRASK